MAWHPDHKQHSRKRILNAAATLFARKGFDNTGINDIMEEAGMTRGAFYHHFSSKRELYQESLRNAAINRFRQALQDPDDLQSGVDLKRLIETYLDPSHPLGIDGGCPMAFLVTDIAQRDETIRSTYTGLLQGMLHRVQAATGSDQQAVLRQLVLMIGGVAIARAVNNDELRLQLLDACKQGLLPGNN